MSAGEPRKVESALVRCILKAQRAGFAIISGAKEADFGAVAGVCAMGAYERLGRKAPRLALPSRSYELCRAYDAIENGFDGTEEACDENGRPLPRRWLDVGMRLRARFRPVDVDDLRASERDRVVGLINFTGAAS